VLRDESPTSEQGATARRLKVILFICTANVCRSPMAEAIFNALADDAELPFRAYSAGVAALEGEPMASKAREALEEIGIRAEDHRARQLGEEMLEEADLVLAMAPQHVAELRQLFEGFSHKVHTLPEYSSGVSGEEGITDPYGSSMVAYRASARQISEYTSLVVEDLKQR
jgi:protein-tyrosine phosphatase